MRDSQSRTGRCDVPRTPYTPASQPLFGATVKSIALLRWGTCTMLAALLISIGIPPMRAWSAAVSPCSSPIVLPNTTAQAFILPYSSERPLSAQARGLVTALQRHVLFAALKYSSIAVEELVDDESPDHCSATFVMQSVMNRMQPNQIAVFLGGRMFEQHGSVYLESWVSVPRLAADSLSWRFAAGEGGSVAAHLSIDRVVFSPRVIPVTFLSDLAPAQREMQRVYRSPDFGASFSELPSDSKARLQFLVLEARGDWMHVRILPGADSGWIESHALIDGDDLKGQFPELYFVDGLIGYSLLTRNATAATQIRGQPLADYVRSSLRRYLNFTEARPETDARALAHILSGNALLAAVGPRSLVQRSAEGRTSRVQVCSYRRAQLNQREQLLPGMHHGAVHARGLRRQRRSTAHRLSSGNRERPDKPGSARQSCHFLRSGGSRQPQAFTNRQALAEQQGRLQRAVDSLKR